MCSRKDKLVVYKSWILIFSRILIYSETGNNYIVKNNWISGLEEILAVKDYFFWEGLLAVWGLNLHLGGVIFIAFQNSGIHLNLLEIFFSFLIPAPLSANLSQMLGHLTFHRFLNLHFLLFILLLSWFLPSWTFRLISMVTSNMSLTLQSCAPQIHIILYQEKSS